MRVFALLIIINHKLHSTVVLSWLTLFLIIPLLGCIQGTPLPDVRSTHVNAVSTVHWINGQQLWGRFDSRSHHKAQASLRALHFSKFCPASQPACHSVDSRKTELSHWARSVLCCWDLFLGSKVDWIFYLCFVGGWHVSCFLMEFVVHDLSL